MLSQTPFFMDSGEAIRRSPRPRAKNRKKSEAQASDSSDFFTTKPFAAGFGSIDVVLALELFDATAAIHEFLLAREIRMASRTYVETNFGLCRFGFKRIPTGAGHLAIHICGVYLRFHDPLPPSESSCTVIFVHPTE
jgi:hypothetical protein